MAMGLYEVTYTQVSYMRSCPRKYKFRYIDLLRPKKKDKTLLRGTVIHKGFEQLFSGGTLASVLGYIVRTYDDAISKASPEEQEDLIVGKHTCYGMFMYYPYANLKIFKEIIPEEKFTVRVDGLRGVRLTGKVDGRVLKDGKWWLRELKTTGSGKEQAEARASVSYQASGYLYGETKALNIPIQGVLYDFIFSSRLRKGVKDTATSYGERIVDDYKQHMVDKRSGRQLTESRLYHRYYSYRTPYQIAEYENDLVKAIKDIRRCKCEDSWARNPDACYFFNKECPYKKICWMEKVDSSMIKAYYDVGTVQNVELV